MNTLENQLYEQLAFLYGDALASSLSGRLAGRLSDFKIRHPELSSAERGTRFNERDIILITYGDMVQSEGASHLRTLAGFLNRYAAGAINTVHILPFYPYSSDDGYAVIDYRKVNPQLGSWEDVRLIGDRFKLMFDGVFNHISSQSEWFLSFLKQEPKYQDYFITVEPGTDLSGVFRPRPTPPYTRVTTSRGDRLVWTTYSSDQIDLNYQNPAVLFEVLEIILDYISRGGRMIRIDGAAYLWKEIGTTCINLPQTHTIIQLIRTVLDFVAPQVAIFTQTNVPHDDNVKYYGNGQNEAQLVYNFALPFLTLHAFNRGDASKLSSWAANMLWPVGGKTAFYNFLAGHDGIGMLPVYDILNEQEIEFVVERVKALGGDVSVKLNEDGTYTPYELNVNFLDALGDPGNRFADPALICARFLASQAILLALPGVPGIYFHSLFGSQGWRAGVRQTGQARAINRQKLDVNVLEKELADPESLRSLVFRGYLQLLRIRAASQAFHPAGMGQILSLHPGIFSILRVSADSQTHVICLHNVTGQSVNVCINLRSLLVEASPSYSDMNLSRKYFSSRDRLDVEIAPYQVMWLQNQ